MPHLAQLQLGNNPLGKEGFAALAAPLRNLHALKGLYLWDCRVCDEGVAALVDNLGKDDFKELEKLDLDNNIITDAGMAKLVAALDAGGLPKLVVTRSRSDKFGSKSFLGDNPASTSAVRSVEEACHASSTELVFRSDVESEHSE